MITPHSAPSTTIGLANPERTRSARTTSGMPGADASSVSNRAARPVRRTSATTYRGSSSERSVGGGSRVASVPIAVTVPSTSKRRTADVSAPTAPRPHRTRHGTASPTARPARPASPRAAEPPAPPQDGPFRRSLPSAPRLPRPVTVTHGSRFDQNARPQRQRSRRLRSTARARRAPAFLIIEGQRPCSAETTLFPVTSCVASENNLIRREFESGRRDSNLRLPASANPTRSA